MPNILTNAGDSFRLGDYTVLNNTWNVGSLIAGVDYTQSVTYNPTDLRHGTVFSWAYGPDDSKILAYPEIMLGLSPWNPTAGSAAVVMQISSLRDLNLTYDVSISGQTDHFNVAYDLWLTDTPGGGPESITTEMMIWLHSGNFSPAGTKMAVYHGAGFTADIWMQENFSAAPGVEWRYLAVMINQDRLSGQIDLDGLLRFMTARGLVSGADYLTGIELGAEVNFGSGSLTINNFDYQLSRYSITTGADSLVGTAQDDVINALAGDDKLLGGLGKDRLTGGLGNYSLYGGDGADVLIGNSGNDRLVGGAGADRMFGGTGLDVMTGGLGADVFYFHTLGDSATVATRDRITDFNHSEADKIDLHNIDANTALLGDQAFHFVGAAGFSGTAGELRLLYTATQTFIMLDNNGDSQADMMIAIQGNLPIAAEDLIL
jgi:serralysin